MNNFYKNLGFHVPVIGGIDKIFKIAESLKINNMQVFTGPNIRWSFEKEINPETLNNFNKNRKKFGFARIFSHGCYLTNLASDDIDLKKKSEKSLIAEINRCDQLKIEGVVFHPGSNVDKKKGIKNITESLKIIKNETDQNVKIFLENSAGQGNTIPSIIEELAEIYNLCHEFNKDIGVVIDTCHSHSAGYDFSNEREQEKFWKKFNNLIGYEKIGFIHLNDSKKNCGTKIDRHENIGKGSIGIKGFEFIMKNKNLKNIVKIMETPFDGIEIYKKEIELLNNFQI